MRNMYIRCFIRLVNREVLIIVVAEDVEVVGVDGDVEIVVVAGADLGDGGGGIEEAAERHGISGGDIRAGDMASDRAILVVNVVGTLDGQRRGCAHSICPGGIVRGERTGVDCRYMLAFVIVTRLDVGGTDGG